uniref:DNA-directed RNA polymerase subunit n=1 Tax=Chenopodium quinoa TaxID=63459 RepID=A0A803LML4_CHEQI
MFMLSEIEHRLRLPPKLLDRPLEEAIKGELESIFLDKVIAKTGLCVSIYDIKSIDGGFVLPVDGAPTYTVVFRMVMFRPYVGEIIAAKLKNSNKKGLQLSLGFFDDIYIPAFALPDPSHIEPHDDDPKQVKWVWTYNELELSYDDGSAIRFQVTSVDYPPIPLEQEEGSKPFAPMVVTLIDTEITRPDHRSHSNNQVATNLLNLVPPGAMFSLVTH